MGKSFVTLRSVRAKPRVPRVVHVECATAEGYRWLKRTVRGATLTPDGFSVTDESEWSESLRAAGGREVV
jgi:hypothetical protein